MKLMEKATKKEFWEQVRTGEEYRVLREMIIGIYNENRMDSIPVLGFALRMRFFDDGDRTEFQKPYYRRRSALSTAALLALIYPDTPAYLKETEELIWAICEEYTWALPAHCAGDERDLAIIDLFAAETAFTLAEIRYLLNDRLHPLISRRIQSEVEKRIVNVYATGSWWWETSGANWAAVCAGNVGGALMYLFPERLAEFLPRLLATLQCFRKGFPADGTCLEGVSYWDYGFGCFTCFAELLYQYTDGKTNLFAWENVDNIACYLQRCFLKGNTAVSFSDGSPNTKADRGLQSFLRQKFPGKLSGLGTANCTFGTRSILWQSTFRNIYYLDDAPLEKPPARQDYYLPDAGQVIINREAYSLAAKAGHNNEPHNHNDIGSFILSTEKGQVLCDLGAGLYTRDYFHPETRYDHFCTSSAGHSVPIIDGKHQKPGAEHSGTLSYRDGVISIEFQKAYALPEKLERTISCHENTVTLTDSFPFPYETFTERFVTLFPPVLGEGTVQVADVAITYDSQTCLPQITETVYINHKNLPVTVYCLDFVLATGLQEISFTCTVEEAL